MGRRWRRLFWPPGASSTRSTRRSATTFGSCGKGRPNPDAHENTQPALLAHALETRRVLAAGRASISSATLVASQALRESVRRWRRRARSRLRTRRASCTSAARHAEGGAGRRRRHGSAARARFDGARRGRHRTAQGAGAQAAGRQWRRSKVVVSGDEAAFERAVKIAKQKEELKRAMMLTVSAPCIARADAAPPTLLAEALPDAAPQTGGWWRSWRDRTFVTGPSGSLRRRVAQMHRHDALARGSVVHGRGGDHILRGWHRQLSAVWTRQARSADGAAGVGSGSPDDLAAFRTGATCWSTDLKYDNRSHSAGATRLNGGKGPCASPSNASCPAAEPRRAAQRPRSP